MILQYELAAVGAAVCWAITPLLAAPASSYLGALAFNRLRQATVALLLLAFVLMTGRAQSLNMTQLATLLVSGIIGIFAGDTLLFLALNRIGPRRNSVLFALNAPLTAILGWLVLGESLSRQSALGVAITFVGVVLAILFGNKDGRGHLLDTVKGKLWVGLALGFGAAMGQAVGSIVARPVMAAGFDPFLASTVRLGAAACCLTLLMALPFESVKPKKPLTRRIAVLTIASGILAMGIGMTLLLFALSGGKIGIIATLSATSPVLILPLLWWKTKEIPAAGAWTGAALTVLGMGLIFAG